MLTQKFMSSFLVLLPVVWKDAWHALLFISLAFGSVFLSFVCGAHVNISPPYRSGPNCWVAEDICFFFFFASLVYLGLEWVQWGVFIISCFILSFILWCRPPSAVHPPSKDRAPPYILVSSCAAWTFGGWKCQSSPHQVCVEETSPPSRYNVGKWTATKSFLAITLFLALCRQPHSVLRKLCVKEWLPVSSPER